jgi:hypothetical protein
VATTCADGTLYTGPTKTYPLPLDLPPTQRVPILDSLDGSTL